MDKKVTNQKEALNFKNFLGVIEDQDGVDVALSDHHAIMRRDHIFYGAIALWH